VSDIVERLRNGEPCRATSGVRCRFMDARYGCLCAIAADEITRLTAEVEKVGRDYNTVRDAHDDWVREITRLRAENERLRAALELYREAVRIDATMEGPKFMGSNASALKRAWDADRAALEEK
jgi:hypothetical protein